MKLMGIDYGRRRIGLAVTDEEGFGIRGLGVIDRKKKDDYFSELISIIRTENPQILVFGLPLDIEDKETVMSEEVRRFACKVEKEISLPVEFVDESLSSRKASQLLSLRKKKHRRNKALVDRIAACLILERYREDHQ